MENFGSLPPCTYHEAVALLGPAEDPPEGFKVYLFDSNGEEIRGMMAKLVKKKFRIAVNPYFNRTISDAKRRVKEQIEPILFNTREVVNFDLALRVSISPATAFEIATNHFDRHKAPEELFYSYFGQEFRMLLESSAEVESADIDSRIAAHKGEWEKLLREKLRERFGINVEINFDIKKTVEQDIVLATDPSAPLRLAFSDRIDQKMPLRVELHIRKRKAGKAGQALPRDLSRLRNNVWDFIRKISASDLSLYDYWYRPKHLQDFLWQKLDTYFEDYAYEVSNLVAVRDEGSEEPPPKSQKLQTSVRWQDSRQYELEFRAEAISEISPHGAGLYDRSGRPERSQWFDEAITDCLNHVLAGVAINDLSEEHIEAYSGRVKDMIAERAESVGLRLDVFFGSVFLPLQNRTKVRRIRVPEGEYRTEHPKIMANFTMEMEIRFENRRALEPFFVEYARQNPAKGNSVPSDEFIDEKLIEVAQEAAEHVIQKTSPETYFSNYIGEARWNASMSTLPEPGGKSDKDNLIFQKLESLLQNQYPGVTLLNLHFHRLDRGLESLRQLVADVRTIEFECVIRDRLHGDAGLDRSIRGYVTVESGSAERVVSMLDKDFHTKSTYEFKKMLEKHLQIKMEGRLAHISPPEVESLMRSMTETGKLFGNRLVSDLEDFLRKSLEHEFGIIAGSFEFLPDLSEGEIAVRNFKKDEKLLSIDTIKTEYMSLQKQLGRLLKEREEITSTTVEDNSRRQRLTDEIEKTKTAISKLRSTSSRSQIQSAADVIRDADSIYLPHSNQERLPPANRDQQADPKLSSPEGQGDDPDDGF